MIVVINQRGICMEFKWNIILAVIPVIVTLVELLVQFVQLANLRQEIEGKQIIVHDTFDLREALSQDLEGVWSLDGKFAKFQNITDKTHTSRGYLVLTWNVHYKYYEAFYFYSVLREFESDPILTAICRGNSQPRKSKSKVYLSFNIEDRVDSEKTVNFNKRFNLDLVCVRDKQTSKISQLKTDFETPTTSGVLIFRKIF